MAVITSEDYKQVIYTGGAEHSLKLWINDVLQDNIEENIEIIESENTIFPSGSDVFNINDLVSKKVTITFHDIPYNTITAGQIKFSIGTYIESEEDYEYVPMGIYNIEEIQENENNRITVVLRDNSVKLDVPYNAKPLIDENEGEVTLLQILNNICDTCGITSKVQTFLHDDKLIGIYDNTINARIYVNYIAGQAGAIPIIDRDGELDFVYTTSLTTHKIPLNIISGYEIGETFTISKVVWESGDILFQHGTNTNDTMFIDSANVYISEQSDIDDIFDIVDGFSINSAAIPTVLGDPAIDPYDLIEVYGYYDENDNFVDDDTVILFTTFANCNFRYTGKCLSSYSTNISKEKREQNVTLNTNETFKKSVNTKIDLVNARITTTIEDVNDIDSRVLIIEENADSFNIEVVNQQITNATNPLQEQIDNNTSTIATNSSNIETMQGQISEMNFNFSTAGLNIGSLGDDISSTLNNQGLKIYNLGTLIAIFNKNGAGVNKLIAVDSIQLQNLSLRKRTISWENPFTSTSETIDVISGFWLKDLVEDLEDLEG